MGCMELSSSSCDETDVPIDLRQVSHESVELPKGGQANCPVLWGKGLFPEVNPGE